MDYFSMQLGITIPTDELHHFSEGWLNHQPDYCWDWDRCETWIDNGVKCGTSWGFNGIN